METKKSVYTIAVALVLAGLVSVAVARTWTSANGKFSVEATLVDFKDGKVKLKKADGKVIDVPLSSLCEEDQQLVKKRFTTSKEQPFESREGYREWKSRDGKFTISAKMLDYDDGKIHLLKSDGKKLSVPIKKLSSADRRWVSEEMRRRRQSGSTSDKEPENTEAEDTGEADEDDESETEWTAESGSSDITGSLGEQTVDMKLVALKFPTGRKRATDPLTLRLLSMINAQRFHARASSGKYYNYSESAFKKLVKKEPKYTSKKPFRAVAQFGSKRCVFALDAVGKKTKGFNRLYFDTNGNGDLTDDAPINTKNVKGSSSSNVQAVFSKIKVPLDLDGVDVEHVMRMNVSCFKSAKYSYTTVSLQSAVVREGLIEHEGKKVRILLVDHNSNGRFDDNASLSCRGKNAYFRMGDVFLVNPGTKSQKSTNAPPYRPVNRSVCLGENYYTMTVSPSGNQMKLKPLQVATGRVTNYMPDYQVIVYNDKHGVMMLSGKKNQKITLPEGKWKLAEYTIVDEGRKRTQIRANFPSDAKPVNVTKDSTVEMVFGSPYRGVVTASKMKGNKVFLSLAIMGEGGEKCTSFYIKGKRPPNPTFEILDNKGKVVHSGKFEYG